MICVRNLDRRLTELERRILEKNAEGPFQGGPSETLKQLRACLNEIGHLKASCARSPGSGARGPSQNIPLQILGPGYSYSELWRLAAERAVPEEWVEPCLSYLREVWDRSAQRRGRTPDAVVEWERAR